MAGKFLSRVADVIFSKRPRWLVILTRFVADVSCLSNCSEYGDGVVVGWSGGAQCH